jgi:uncharacterized protein YbaA (DUF1428 family)
MYVDGFVIAVPKSNKDAYVKVAAGFSEAFKEYGGLAHVECWADDVPNGQWTDFYRAVQCKEDETVVFSWLTWPDKATRDAANVKMMTDPRMQMEEAKRVFDGKRMIYGGFVPIFEA